MAAIDELRNKPFATGEKLRGVQCPSCGQTNEEYKTLCIFCGERLIALAAEIKPPSQLATTAKGLGMLAGGAVLWVILGFLGLIVVCLFLGSLFNRATTRNYPPTATRYLYTGGFGKTATVKAQATLAAGGVLPTRKPTRTPTLRPGEEATPEPTNTKTAAEASAEAIQAEKERATAQAAAATRQAASVPPTKIPDYLAYAGEQFSDLGNLKSSSGEISIGNCEFENGQMFIVNPPTDGVFVLFNDGRWQFISQEQIETAIENKGLLTVDDQQELSYTYSPFWVGAWLHLGGLNSGLGKAKRLCAGYEGPSDIPGEDVDAVYYFDNGSVLKYVLGEGFEINTYVLYPSGQWMASDVESER